MPTDDERPFGLVVTSRGQVVARVSPPAPAAQPLRRLGLLRGKIHYEPGWDEPDRELIETMERGDDEDDLLKP